MGEILVLYYSRHGSTAALARKIANGVEEVPDMQARIRTVPAVALAQRETIAEGIPEDGPPYVRVEDLVECRGLVYGSPTRFGNMAAAMKAFWDGTAAQWLSGALAGKPGAVFTASTSMHGGQESTLLSMQLPLLHHGMLIVGLPYSEAALTQTETGGSPYGATHWSGPRHVVTPSEHEKQLARALGRRVAEIARALDRGR